MRPGENIFALPSTKIAEFEAKNRRKSRIFAVCCFCFYPELTSSLKTALNKAISVGGSNNAGVWGRPSRRRPIWWVRSRHCGDFIFYSRFLGTKNTHF